MFYHTGNMFYIIHQTDKGYYELTAWSIAHPIPYCLTLGSYNRCKARLDYLLEERNN